MRWCWLAVLLLLTCCSQKKSLDKDVAVAKKAEPEKAVWEDGTQCLNTRKQTGKGCDMEGIVAAVRSARAPGGPVQGCYLQHVRPPREGKVQLKFALLPDGSAHGFQTARDDFGSPALVGCLAGVLQSLSYPAPGDVPCQVVYPFTFVPEVKRGP